MIRTTFPSHSAMLAIQLNACGRYLLVDVLRTDYDATNGGITADKSVKLFAPCPEGNWTWDDLLAGVESGRNVILEVCPSRVMVAPSRSRMPGISVAVCSAAITCAVTRVSWTCTVAPLLYMIGSKAEP
jgi:hypothetical protein